jgi:hypothetical protein
MGRARRAGLGVAKGVRIRAFGHRDKVDGRRILTELRLA